MRQSITQQSMLDTSNFMTHNPPSHRARSKMMTKMKKLHHCKGPTWTHRFGQDMNLAGTGAQSHVKNNPTSIDHIFSRTNHS